MARSFIRIFSVSVYLVTAAPRTMTRQGWCRKLFSYQHPARWAVAQPNYVINLAFLELCRKPPGRMKAGWKFLCLSGYAVWTSHHFAFSFREAEDLIAARGIAFLTKRSEFGFRVSVSSSPQSSNWTGCARLTNGTSTKS